MGLLWKLLRSTSTWGCTLIISWTGLETLRQSIKKAKADPFFLRRQRSFNICRTMLRIFYESVVASAIFFAVTCWGSGLKVADNNRLHKLIRRASDVMGEELDTLTTVAERRMLSKLQSILDNVTHPLYDTLAQQRSTFSGRLLLPRCTTERHRKSFLPVAIKLCNASLESQKTPLL